jgi:uncharacterized RDD family membrane protein YckC
MIDPEAPSLTQTIDVETPELVVLSYNIAGLGSRVSAAIIDFLISIGTLILVIVALAMVEARTKGSTRVVDPSHGTVWALALLGVLVFVVQWGYYVVFEGFFDGQTPGKRLFRLRVVRDGGYSVGFAASAVRNLMRAIDAQPGAS